MTDAERLVKQRHPEACLIRETPILGGPVKWAVAQNEDWPYCPELSGVNATVEAAWAEAAERLTSYGRRAGRD